MSAVVERETVEDEFQYQQRNLEQLEASIAATDVRLARIREAIHGLGYQSVAQALEGTPADDSPVAPHPSDSPNPSDSPPGRAAGLLQWLLVVPVVALPIFFISLSSLRSPASNNPPPQARATKSEPKTTAIAPREDRRALPDISNTDTSLRQPEPSTDAPSDAPREPETTRIVIRSTLPPSEDDPSPAEPRTAPAPPPIAPPGTVDTVVTSPTPLLDLGQIEDAKRIQRRLIELGFLFGPADGNWGPRSLKALRDFRSAQGIGNSDTWEKTQQVLFSPTAARAPVAGTFVGAWGINADQCRQTPDNRSPLTISTNRADAFSTTCQFNSTQREGANEWRIRATCANEHDRWNANIRLTLAGSRLTWTSERGTATYLRCPVVWN